MSRLAMLAWACCLALATAAAAATADGSLLAMHGRDFAGGPGTAVFLGRSRSGGQAWFAAEAATLPALQAAQWIDLRRAF